MENNSKRKVCIFGNTGMLGHLVFDYLSENGFDVYGVSNEYYNDLINTVVLDVRDFDSVRNYLYELRPDYIVNCIGILNKECDLHPELAFYINSVFPHLLNEVAVNIDSFLVHVSTDFVFSGKEKKYYIDSQKDGVSLYSVSKSIGEVVNSKKALTIRTSLIGPNKYAINKGLFNWFIFSDNVFGYKNVYWSGVTTLEFAKYLVYCFDSKPFGLQHLVNNKMISKYDLLIEFNRYRKERAEIKPANSDACLKIKLVPECSDYKVKEYKEMFGEMYRWIKLHSKTYASLSEKLK